MGLVERHPHLVALDAAYRDAAAGHGRVVLVTGEAGAGKTALVTQFASTEVHRGKVLWGMCDELVTPRPLGPVRDMIAQLGGDPTEDAGQGLLDSLMAALGHLPRPAVVLVEDAHWADEATLDAIRFVGRRVGWTSTLLVITFRADEVPADHRLRVALAAIPPGDVRHVDLPPLSRRGVAELAGHDDIDELYRLTGGNPFYVTEVLASPSASVPTSVQDAVMARVGRLSDQARSCAETVSVIPSRTERWLLEQCGVVDGADEATRVGILRSDRGQISFTHELARRAVEHSLAPSLRREINSRVLDVLAGTEAEPARLAHHAVQAEDPSAVARYAPAAARLAASLNAHREAAAHFDQALRYPDQFTEAELCALLEEYAQESKLTADHHEAEHALLRAIELRRGDNDRARLGFDLCSLSDVHWFQGRGDEAEAVVAEAITTLEAGPPGPELARAYAQRSKLALLDFRVPAAAEWGERAVALARSLDQPDILANALTSAGVANWLLGSDGGNLVVEGLELALAEGLADEASRAYVNLATVHTNYMQFERAELYLRDGLVYCQEHDLIARARYLIATRAWWHLQQGRWPDAERDAHSLLDADDVSRITASWVLGWLQTRRGDARAEATLNEAARLAELSGEAQHTLPIASIRAELAWLRGDDDAVSSLASSALAEAVRTGSQRWIGQLALWLHRVGALEDVPPDLQEPFADQIAGRWYEAAAGWAALGLPYERADALAEASEQEPLLAALEILDELGAKPRASMVRRRLAELGTTRVPRGPRKATRASPAGLTTRQTEVLRLLAEGLTYQEIADRLYLSVKTVDHHAAAVRTKLAVSTRDEAVAAGRRLGILEP